MVLLPLCGIIFSSVLYYDIIPEYLHSHISTRWDILQAAAMEFSCLSVSDNWTPFEWDVWEQLESNTQDPLIYYLSQPNNDKLHNSRNIDILLKYFTNSTEFIDQYLKPTLYGSPSFIRYQINTLSDNGSLILQFSDTVLTMSARFNHINLISWLLENNAYSDIDFNQFDQITVTLHPQ